MNPTNSLRPWLALLLTADAEGRRVKDAGGQDFPVADGVAEDLQ